MNLGFPLIVYYWANSVNDWLPRTTSPLAELIKNAYDADAIEAKVIFRNAKIAPSEKSEICISDNGHGMTFRQIRDFWMRIATPNKLRNPISPRFGRKNR